MALTFGQVTDILLLANNIPEARKATFVARLKQWQKMGFPEGVKGVGRGVKVDYGATQLYQLGLLMRLLSLGLTPERAQGIILSAWRTLADAILVTALRKANGDGDYCYLLIQYDALTDLKDPDADHDHLYVYPTMGALIVDAFEGIEDLPEEHRESFEEFQYSLRNAMVNAIVLEIDSIVLRLWGAMTKLGIPPETIGDDMKAWLAALPERRGEEEQRDAPKFEFSDNLAGVKFCPGCFVVAALDLPPKQHEAMHDS